MRKGKMATYNAWRYAIWTGDILEWSSKSALGRLIQWFTGYDVNHTSQVVRFTNFDTERIYNLESLAPGVYPNLLSRRLENHNGHVYWLQLKPEFDYLRPDIAREGLKYVGTKYDYKSLIRQAVARVSSQADTFFCSELVYQAGLDAGLPIEQEYAPRPGDFSKIGIYKPRIQIL